MVLLVHGNDAWTALQIGQQTSAWGTAATGSGNETFYTVPLVTETLNLQRDVFPPPREFGGAGYREFIEFGRSFVQGSFTVLGRYDAKWFNILLAHAHYSELAVVTECFVDGTALAAGNNTHIYHFSATLPLGLTIKVWKGGAAAAAANATVETFVGCMITGFTVEQPENDVARFTFNFIGKSVASAAGSGSIAAIGGLAPIKTRDLSNTYSKFLTGTTPTALNFRSFRLTVDRHLELDPSFMNSPDTVEQPGIADVREVTGEIQSFIEQDFYNRANATPYADFQAKTKSKISIIFAANATDFPLGVRTYALRLELPAIYWERADVSIKEGGVNDATYAFRAVSGTFDQTGNLPDTQTGDLRALTTVKETDEPSVDAKFSVL